MTEDPSFSPPHSPTIVNGTNHTIVVFQERGTLYNRQVLQPQEAVSMSADETGGGWFLPYRVHAVIGDDKSLPSDADSMKNLVKVSAIPAAFIAGCFATAISAGMLVGPSVALAPLVSGMVVNGVVIDSAALAAGGLMATRAQAVTDFLLREQPDKFMNKTNRMRPGTRFLLVKGGLNDGPVSIDEISKREFQKQKVIAWKRPLPKSRSGDEVKYILDKETESAVVAA
eukprot:Nitzschia sp. Nitz4//scaffold12_size214221//191433//192116//NITZ4_001534-RA/size214221-processed-gene-0.182-mRNA-1//-1//CDS//3329535122//2642//frame0